MKVIIGEAVYDTDVTPMAFVFDADEDRRAFVKEILSPTLSFPKRSGKSLLAIFRGYSAAEKKKYLMGALKLSNRLG